MDGKNIAPDPSSLPPGAEGRAGHSSLLAAIAAEISARPFAPSGELCRRFGLTRQELRDFYAAIRRSPAVRATFSSSPFFFLVKVLEKLCQDRPRTLQIL